MKKFQLRRTLLLSAAINLLCLAMATTSHGDEARTALPFKLFDGHLHLVADDIQRYPRTGAGNPPPGSGAGLPPGVGGQSGGMGAVSPRAETDITRVVKWMKEENVDGIAAVQKRGTYGTDNSYILDAADAHKTQVAPVVVLDAENPNTPEQLRKLIKERGVAGLRLTGAPSADGSLPWLNSPQALQTWKVANDAGIVLDIMITNQDNSASVPQIIKLARDFPNVRLVLDHALYPKTEGAPEFGLNAAYRSMAAQKNIYYKFSTINLDFLREANLSAADFVRHLVDVYGADHVLWGSDLGNSGGSYKELIARIVASTDKLNAKEKRTVLHDTGAKVFVRGGTINR